MAGATTCALLGTLAAASATPAAAPVWDEQASRVAPGGGVADCLRTGAPGQLATLGALGPATIATDLLTLTGPEIAPAGTVTLGWLVNCPAVASAPGVGTLLAAPVYDPGRRDWVMRVTEPASGRADDLGRQSSEGVYPPAVAVARSGAAVVAWYSDRLAPDRRSWERRLLVATRPRAGAPFGAPQVAATDTDGDPGTAPQLGVDDSGRFTIAWHTVRRRGTSGQESRVHAALVAPDARLVASQQLASTSNAVPPTLAVAPDGGALVALAGEEHLELFERPPGASAFAAVPLPVPRGTDGELAVALASGGAAVVADRTETESIFADPIEPDTVVAFLRPPGGAFGAPQLVSGRLENESANWFGISLPSGRPRTTEPPIDSEHQALSAALGPDGEVLLTWVDPPTARRADTARVARGTLTGGFAEPRSVGSRCRMSNAVKPLRQVDGALAIAWTDNARVRTSGPLDATVRGRGALHVATPVSSAAPPAPASGPRPRAEVEPVEGALRVGESLRLRVRCSGGPCDVRAVADAVQARPPRDPAHPRGRPDPDDPDDDASDSFERSPPLRPTASTTLAANETGELLLETYPGFRIAPLSGGGPKVRLTTCAPGGAVSVATVVRPRVRGLPSRPIPWLRHVRARQHGGRIHVSWRTAAPARFATFHLAPIARDDDYVRRPIVVHGRGRSAFARSFSVPDARAVSQIELALATPEWGGIDSVRARTARER